MSRKTRRNEPKYSADFYMHTDRPHNEWYHQPVMGRLGDSRGHLAHGKAKKQTSGRVKHQAGSHS